MPHAVGIAVTKYPASIDITVTIVFVAIANHLVPVRQHINPHRAFTKEELDQVFQAAEADSPALFALVSLLTVGAMRLQDAVGLTFRDVTAAKPGKDGKRKLLLKAKKTTAREVQLTAAVVRAVKDYQAAIGAAADDIMFSPGTPSDPTAKWSKRLSRFFKGRGLAVRSHDFRTTMITSFYNQTKDLALTQEFVQHADINTTRGYIKLGQAQVQKEAESLVAAMVPSKRTKT